MVDWTEQRLEKIESLQKHRPLGVLNHRQKNNNSNFDL